MRQITDSKEKLKNSTPEKTGKENVQGDHSSRRIMPPSTIPPTSCLLGLTWDPLSTPGAELQSRAPELTVTSRFTEERQLLRWGTGTRREKDER